MTNPRQKYKSFDHWLLQQRDRQDPVGMLARALPRLPIAPFPSHSSFLEIVEDALPPNNVYRQGLAQARREFSFVVHS